MQQRKGSTLLLALVILGGIVGTSLALGGIVVTRLRDARTLDNAVVASYAAETGVEELLYRVRKERVLTNLNTEVRLTNGATWQRTASALTREVTFDLARDTVEQLDLFNVSGDFADVGVRALRVAALQPEATAWLEVTWVPWLQTGEWAPAVGRVFLGPAELRSQAQNGNLIDLAARPAQGTPVAYRIRLRALGGRIGMVRVRATSDRAGQQIVEFPSRIQARVVGSMDRARYALQATFPARFPLAPVFDYVLFSECDIVKGGSINCP